MNEGTIQPAAISPARRLLLTGLLLAVVAVWGWTFVVVKDAIAIHGVLPFLAVRFTLGAACLGIVCARRMNWRTVRAGAAIGVVLGAGFLLQTLGLARTSASNTGLITGLFVIFAPLANRLLFGVRVRPVLWLAIVLSLVGLALLTGAATSGIGYGELLTLGCAAMFGLHVALLDRFAKRHDAVVLTFGQIAGAALIFLVCCAGQGAPLLPPPAVWPALVITGVFASAVAFLVQTCAQQRLSAIETAMILLAEPLFAVLFGWLLHGDRMTLIQMGGGALMVVTMVFAEWRRGRENSAPT